MPTELDWESRGWDELAAAGHEASGPRARRMVKAGASIASSSPGLSAVRLSTAHRPALTTPSTTSSSQHCASPTSPRPPPGHSVSPRRPSIIRSPVATPQRRGLPSRTLHCGLAPDFGA
jgi:hypothetical protein